MFSFSVLIEFSFSLLLNKGVVLLILLGVRFFRLRVLMMSCLMFCFRLCIV